jgi:hypothetical protein
VRTEHLRTGTDASLEAEIDLPDGAIRAGLITLHGASSGSLRQPLFRHVTGVAGELGVATLRFDRRSAPGFEDVRFDMQAADAVAALRELAGRIGDVPLGAWAFSQGTWPATILLDRGDVSFAILVGAPAATPSEQMRHAIPEQVRRAGHDPDAAAELWAAVEAHARGGARADAQVAVDRAAGEPWFELTGIPRILPEGDSWHDADHDPRPAIARVRGAVLLVLGERDGWVDVAGSLEAWASSPADVTTLMLPGADHAPTDTGRSDGRPLPRYTEALRDWLRARLA